MAGDIKRPERMLTEGPGRDVRRFYWFWFCIHASWRQISADRDTGNGREASGTEGRL